ncbi:SprT family protein [Aciduricibacillus chroicocephali]|uniref:SprT family protein n=1 Tax=Aciduricibacillus chroicocephali TaxID=3054939 RepID=A0ABY9KWA0_9BACI|nr:SprT family protein [Bacillaceae bacterium 44XB]
MEILSETELHELVNKISLKYFFKPYIDSVCFNSRLRTTGGRYIPARRLIELNPKYLIEADREEFIGIIKHELCHYHLHIEGKKFGHADKSFKELLKATGSPRFCNPLPSQSRKTYIYLCTKCNMEYKRKRRVDINRFSCGRCRGKLELIKDLRDS